VDGRLFVQEYVRSSCVSGHRFVNLVHKHSYGFVHPKPNTLFHLIPAQRHSQTVVRHTRKANRTNSTFGFCRHAKPTLKKPKELFFANARPKIEQNTENRKMKIG
jgi:hypothetical protein